MVVGDPSPASALAAPNVLVIVTDDQRLDGTMQVMPKTLKWFDTGGDLGGGAGSVSGGRFFPNAVANTPWCCPARSSIFTGDYAHNHGVETLAGSVLGTDESAPMQQRTLQAYLRGAGYRTGIFGKYLNNWEFPANGTQPAVGFNCSPGNTDAPPRPPFFNDYAIFESSSYSPTCVLDSADPSGLDKYVWQYSTNFVRDRAVQFLDQVHSSGQPWFLYVAPYTPHSPLLPEAKYRNASVPALDETASVRETDRTDKPDWVQQKELFDLADIRNNWQQHLRMLKSADDMVDAIMRRLKDNGQADNTIAFFTSDNGYMFGDHGGDSKARPYLASVKVPFYMRWPGHTGRQPGDGTQPDSRLAALVDIAPTALGATGVTAADAKDGISLLPGAGDRKHLFMEQRGAGITPPSWLSILTPTYHYIETYQTDHTTGATDYSQVESREYYDLTKDPLELTNLLGDGDPVNDPPTGGLSAKLIADRGCAGATCPGAGGSDPPLEAKITRGPADDNQHSGSSTVDFYFTSSAPDATFECKLEGESYVPPGSDQWTDCTNPKRYVGLVDGDYTFSVRAKTSGPVYSGVQSYQWHVDGQVPTPETAISVHPPKRSTDQAAWFGFSSSLQPELFMCRLDGGMWQSCTSPKMYSVADTPVSSPHRFEVKAISPDPDSTEDPTPASYEWSVDSTPMEIDPTTFTGTARSYERKATFNFSARALPQSAEPPDKELPTRFECSLDDGAWDPCVSPKDYADLSTGHHTFRVRVTDLAGNVSAPAVPPFAPAGWDVGPVQTYHSLPDTGWPEVTTGSEVRTIVSDGCGGWYIGGAFSAVQGVSGFGNLAHINRNKTVDTGWKPVVSRTGGTPLVRALVANGPVYLGGQFTSVDNTARSNLAAVTPAVGAAPTCAVQGPATVTNWNPSPNNVVYGLTPSPVGVYAAGAFATFTQGSTATIRRKVAEIRTNDTGSLTDWDADVNPGATLLAVATGPDGVYIGGNGLTTVRPGIARTGVAKLDRVTGQATAWNPSPVGGVNSVYWRRTAIGDSVGAAAQLPTVLAGGAFSSMGSPQPGSGQPARSKAAEVEASDEGSATPWDPSLSATAGAAYDILPITTSSTIVGGSFTSVGPVNRGRLAETDRSTGAVLDWNPNPDAAVLRFSYCTLAAGQAAQPNCRVAADRPLPPPVLAVAGMFGNVGTPPQPRRLIAFYCRMDLAESC